jgi:hypothetical protein
MKHLLALTLLLALATACKPKKEAATSNPDPKTTVVTPEPKPTPTCTAISRGAATHKDPIASLTTLVENDCLIFKMTYSGGCKEHTFDLYWDGNWAESIPPIAYVTLDHDSNEDGCEAIKSEKLNFDLKPLRYAGSQQLIIEIKAAGVPMMRANYTYR